MKRKGTSKSTTGKRESQIENENQEPEQEEQQEQQEVISENEEDQTSKCEESSTNPAKQSSIVARVAERLDEEIAPRLEKLDATSWGRFETHYRDYKDNHGRKSMARCISRTLQARLQWRLPLEYRTTVFEKIPDKVIEECFNKIVRVKTTEEINNQLKGIKMKSKKWIYVEDVIEYFIEMDEVLKQAKSKEFPPALQWTRILDGLSNTWGFKDKVEVAMVEQEVDNVDDLQSLILETAEQVESRYMTPTTSRAPQGHIEPTRSEKISPRPHEQKVKTEPLGDQGYRPRSAPAPRRTMRCYNCNGAHTLRDCTEPFNQSVIQANKLAHEEAKARRSTFASRSSQISTLRPQVAMVQPVRAAAAVEVALAKTSHVKGMLIDFNQQISAHIDSGAAVTLINSNLATELQEAGCASRKVDRKVQAFNGTPVQLSTQLLGIQVQITSVSGPVQFTIDPLVADITGDVLIDLKTALQVGLLEIKVPESDALDPTEVGCVQCGAVLPMEEITPLDRIGEEIVREETVIAQDSELMKTIGPDVDRQKLFDLLKQNREAFKPQFTAEGVPGFKIEVKDENNLPRKGPRRLSRNDSLIVEEQIRELLSLGIIRPSSSSVSSPVVLVKYEDKTSRLCVDYRELNENTVDLRYPTRNMREVIDRVAGKKFLGKIDLYKGYHQIPMDVASIPLTAFATSQGLFEYVRLPFGLKNAPAAFQQRMDQLFADLLFRVCEIYLDDIIIFGDTEEAFLKNVETVLQRLIRFHLTAKISKCLFGFKELSFLGFLVSEQGYRMDPKRTESIANMKPPTSKKQLRSYLGLVNYFSTFIPGMAKVARPLYERCHTEQNFHWAEAEMTAFKELQQLIVQAPKLEFLNYDEKIILRTDASDIAAGGVLFQEYNNRIHIIQFMSTAFSKSERNWSTIEKEAYALYYCILHCNHFLSGHHFILQTDHKNLVYLHRAEVPKLVRWRLRLQEYDFTVEHIPGKDNIVADILSRYCHDCIPLVATVTATADSKIRAYHNSTVGHRGVTTTISLLREAGEEWPLMAKDVAEFIRKCPCCQKNRPFQKESNGPNRSLTVYEPFQRLAMDFIGPLPVDENGNAFLLVIVDTFTRWVELFALSSATAESTAECILQIIGRYGLPEEILSDNGPQFTAKMIQTMMTVMDINHIFSTPYHHQGNGHVERCNQEVMRHLRNIVFDEGVYNDWSRYIPRVQYILNCNPHAATGFSPMQLLFGKSITVNRAAPNRFVIPDESGRTVDYYQQKCARIEEMLQAARDQQSRTESRQLNSQTKPIDEFLVNEWVLVTFPTGPATKLHPRRQGPFKIVEKHHRTYTVENIVTKTRYRVDVERISRFKIDDDSLELVERLLARDLQEYIVEGIVDHRKHPEYGWQFLVKWKGYGETQNTWEPISHLKNNVLFKQYVKSKRIKLTSKSPSPPT